MKIFLLIIINYAVWNTGICDTWLHHKTNAILCLELHNNWRPPVFTKCLFNENCYVSSLSGPLMAPVLQQVLQRCWNIWHWKQNVGLNTHHLTHSPAPTDISHFSLLVLLAKYMQLAWLLFSDKQESWVVKAKHSKICWVWFPEPAGMRVHAHNQAIEVQTDACLHLDAHSFSQNQIQRPIHREQKLNKDKGEHMDLGGRSFLDPGEAEWGTSGLPSIQKGKKSWKKIHKEKIHEYAEWKTPKWFRKCWRQNHETLLNVNNLGGNHRFPQKSALSNM